MDDKKQNLGEEVKKAWEDFTKDAAKAKGEIEETMKEFEEGLSDHDNKTYFIAGGVLGSVGLLISLAVKNSVLGAIVVGGSALMIGYGVYLYKREK